ncbi:DUF6448 family protein [Paucihalobacter sp.]|uniref:DUF6448 family protein n=1 Tax=Paucihalobacter sp. TaxID=2850405 RepID=UPI002FE1941A
MNTHKNKKQVKILKTSIGTVLLSLLLLFASHNATAQCDSFEGPVIKDAVKALDNNKVDLVLKWITAEQEREITTLFNKTHALKSQDKDVYEIVEKHFFETLVRLHHESEKAPYTGLKPLGSNNQIIQMTDTALQDDDIENFIVKMDDHLNELIREKYRKVAKLYKVKDNSVTQGRAFVSAYADYTHTIEAIHYFMENGATHN